MNNSTDRVRDKTLPFVTQEVCLINSTPERYRIGQTHSLSCKAVLLGVEMKFESHKEECIYPLSMKEEMDKSRTEGDG